GGRGFVGCFDGEPAARFVYTIRPNLKSGLKPTTFVQFSLQGGSGTCQSSEKFFLFSILGPLCGPFATQGRSHR
ncbi:hypothetical protein, partial [Pseudomonas asiatica]|uniref:hypothetical protein n=3 Tax=Pseudomonas TaxID=286 RepID=UPI001AAF07FD